MLQAERSAAVMQGTPPIPLTACALHGIESSFDTSASLTCVSPVLIFSSLQGHTGMMSNFRLGHVCHFFGKAKAPAKTLLVPTRC